MKLHFPMSPLAFQNILFRYERITMMMQAEIRRPPAIFPSLLSIWGVINGRGLPFFIPSIIGAPKIGDRVEKCPSCCQKGSFNSGCHPPRHAYEFQTKNLQEGAFAVNRPYLLCDRRSLSSHLRPSKRFFPPLQQDAPPLFALQCHFPLDFFPFRLRPKLEFCGDYQRQSLGQQHTHNNSDGFHQMKNEQRALRLANNYINLGPIRNTECVNILLLLNEHKMGQMTNKAKYSQSSLSSRK